MTRQITIQKLLASLLLVLFTISFIPKNYFHDVIATHTDSPGCEHPAQNVACLHQKGFHCSFNHLVVTAPYISFDNTSRLVSPIILSSYTNRYFTPVLQHNFFGTKSRGPPVPVV